MLVNRNYRLTVFACLLCLMLIKTSYIGCVLNAGHVLVAISIFCNVGSSSCNIFFVLTTNIFVVKHVTSELPI